MTSRDCDEILFNEEGKFVGIKSQGEVRVDLISRLHMERC
ncbi:MAG: hypothetical protein GY853_15055 [PVC group bacterium]|nr:hypothetical protein [PVC group bacterium]